MHNKRRYRGLIPSKGVKKNQTAPRDQNYLMGRSQIEMQGRVTMEMKIKIPFDIDPDKEIPIEVTKEI